MTRRFLKKTVTFLINNSFTENILPTSTYNNVKAIWLTKPTKSLNHRQPSHLKGVVRLLQFDQRTKPGLCGAQPRDSWPFSVVRSTTCTSQRISTSQRIKKAETDIIKQFLWQSRNNAHSTQNERAVNITSIGTDGADTPGGLLLSIEQIRNVILSKRKFRLSPPQPAHRSESALYKPWLDDRRPAQPIKSFSEFKKQLYESRKVRILYGNLTRKELHKSIKKAKEMQGGSLGENLLLVLETRLDVTLHRCDLFPTIFAARHSIIHNRVKINRVKLSVPSYQMQAGDVIKVFNQQPCVHQESIGLNATGEGPFHGNARDGHHVQVDDHSTLLLVQSVFGGLQWQYIASADVLWFLSHLQSRGVATLFTQNMQVGDRSTGSWAGPAPGFYVGMGAREQSPETKGADCAAQNQYKAVGEVPKRGNRPADCQPSATRLGILMDKVKDLCKISNPKCARCSLTTSQYRENSTNKAQKHECLSQTFIFNTFCYWSYVKKGYISTVRSTACTLPKPNFTGDAVKNHVRVDTSVPIHSQLTGRQAAHRHYHRTMHYKNHSKALHLEVSHQNLCAIFLFMPQRIPIPACIDYDLLIRRWGG